MRTINRLKEQAVKFAENRYRKFIMVLVVFIPTLNILGKTLVLFKLVAPPKLLNTFD